MYISKHTYISIHIHKHRDIYSIINTKGSTVPSRSIVFKIKNYQKKLRNVQLCVRGQTIFFIYLCASE